MNKIVNKGRENIAKRGEGEEVYGIQDKWFTNTQKREGPPKIMPQKKANKWRKIFQKISLPLRSLSGARRGLTTRFSSSHFDLGVFWGLKG